MIKTWYKLISFGLFLLCFFIVSPTPVSAVDCSGVPISGNYSIGADQGACTFANTVDGVDTGTGTTNTAVLTVTTDGSLSILNGQTIAVGSIDLTGGSITIIDGGTIKTTTPLYADDADSDGYPTSTTLQYISSDTGRVRRNTLTTLSATDCNDSSDIAWQNINGYTDSDEDGYGTGSLQPVCSGSSIATGYTTANNTDCNDTGTSSGNVWVSASCYLDGDNDNYGSTTAKTCTDNATCGSATWGSGGAGTVAASGNFSSNNTDCNDGNASIWVNRWECDTCCQQELTDDPCGCADNTYSCVGYCWYVDCYNPEYKCEYCPVYYDCNCGWECGT